MTDSIAIALIIMAIYAIIFSIGPALRWIGECIGRDWS